MGSAFTDLTRDFGGSVMNAIMGSALAVAYSAAISKVLATLTPSQSADLGTTATQELLGSFEGAQEVARGYPAEVSDQIISAASQAFVDGKDLAVSIALVLAVASAFLVWFAYPRKPEELAFFASIAAENEQSAAAGEAQTTSPASN